MSISPRLKEIFGRRRFAVRPGTERINALLARLDHPERAFFAVHVAGTNGKGSTASFLTAILNTSGCKTGLFTSPHLISYNERFQINGQLVTDDELSVLLDKVLSVATEEDTFFELTTALACLWFAENKVQVAIFEAGMGGGNDATAAVPAVMTLITPIAMDHCQWLGDSLLEIATEKAAIAETGTTILSARQKPQIIELLTKQAKIKQQKLLVAGNQFNLYQEVDKTLVYADNRLKVSGLHLGLSGSYQHENAAVAIAAALELTEIVNLSLSSQQIVQGVAATHWPGRMECIRLPDGKSLLLDGAHNPAGADALLQALQEFPYQQIFLLLGLMEDKAVEEIVARIGSVAKLVIAVQPAQERALKVEKLAAICEKQGIKVQIGNTVADGLALACSHAGIGDLVLVAGSLFLVGEVKALLNGQSCYAVRG